MRKRGERKVFNYIKDFGNVDQIARQIQGGGKIYLKCIEEIHGMVLGGGGVLSVKVLLL